MPGPRARQASAHERVRAEFALIRASVSGVRGSLLATSDGFLVAHDIPDLEPTEIAALVATTRALAARTTLAAGAGQFLEVIVRGSLGYLAVYAAGSSAVLAVIGTDDLNVGMLRYRAGEFIGRIAECSREFALAASAALGRSSDAGPAGGGPVAHNDAPGALPRRRPPGPAS